jgi:hypothetical protein
MNSSPHYARAPGCIGNFSDSTVRRGIAVSNLCGRQCQPSSFPDIDALRLSPHTGYLVCSCNLKDRRSTLERAVTDSFQIHLSISLYNKIITAVREIMVAEHVMSLSTVSCVSVAVETCLFCRCPAAGNVYVTMS